MKYLKKIFDKLRTIGDRPLANSIFESIVQVLEFAYIFAAYIINKEFLYYDLRM